MRRTRARIGKARVLRQAGLANGEGQRGKAIILPAAHAQPAIARAIDAVQRVEPGLILVQPEAVDDLPVGIEEMFRGGPQAGVQLRRLHIIAPPRFGAAFQRHQDARGGQEAVVVILVAEHRPGGRVALAAALAQQAGPARHQRGKAFEQRFGPARAIAGHIGEDQPGVDGGQLVIAQPQLLDLAGAQVVGQHIGLGDQAIGRFQPLGRLQVQHHGALAALGGIKAVGQRAHLVAAGVSTLITSAPRSDSSRPP
jgi:hypothetical protein